MIWESCKKNILYGFPSILNDHEIVRRFISMAGLILRLPVVKNTLIIRISALIIRISAYVHSFHSYIQTMLICMIDIITCPRGLKKKMRETWVLATLLCFLSSSYRSFTTSCIPRPAIIRQYNMIFCIFLTSNFCQLFYLFLPP